MVKPRERAPMRPLPNKFFARPTLEVTPDLLGRTLHVVVRGRACGGRIVETEAYVGEEDPACHAHRGQTPRNRTMYGPPGFAYVYFTYGNHWMLCFVTESEGFPAAVLIRALEPTKNSELIRRRRPNIRREYDLTNGPGKLTAALGISGRDDRARLGGPRLIVGGKPDPGIRIATSGRIGVNEASDRPWRFYVADSPWVSAYRRGVPKRRRTTGDCINKMPPRTAGCERTGSK